MHDFTPGPVARVANCVPGALLVFFAGWNLPGHPVLAAVMAVGGGLLAWRGWRLGVAIEDDAIVIRNFLRTRTVPMTAVSDLADRHGFLFKGLVLSWWTPRRRLRRTRIMAFTYGYQAHVTQGVRRRQDDCAELLWRAICAAQVRGPALR